MLGRKPLKKKKKKKEAWRPGLAFAKSRASFPPAQMAAQEKSRGRIVIDWYFIHKTRSTCQTKEEKCDSRYSAVPLLPRQEKNISNPKNERHYPVDLVAPFFFFSFLFFIFFFFLNKIPN